MRKILFAVFVLPVFLHGQTSRGIHALPNPDRLFASAKSDAEKAELRKTFTIMAGALTDLEGYRQRFLQDGKFINLFPSAYYHTTLIEMQDIAQGKFSYPAEKLKQLIAFYDAYAFNRRAWDSGNKLAVELHWREHFAFAELEEVDQNIACARVAHVLATAVIAHVRHDLPRAIRHAFNNRFNKTLTADDARLAKDFAATDLVFDQSMERVIKDVAAGRKYCSEFSMSLIAKHNFWYSITLHNAVSDAFPSIREFFNLRDILTSEDVIEMRHLSWRQALRGSALRGLDGGDLAAQPVLKHNVDYSLLPSTGKPGDKTPKSLFRYHEIKVDAANGNPLETGIKVQPGDYVFVEVAGKIVVGSNFGEADGSGLLKWKLFSGLFDKYDGHKHGSVIIKLGDSIMSCKRIFSDLGEQYNAALLTPDYGDRVKDGGYRLNYIPGFYFIAETSGTLEFDINDARTSDNSGSFVVRIFILSYKDHVGRNVFNQCPSTEPVNGTDCLGGKWVKESVNRGIITGSEIQRTVVPARRQAASVFMTTVNSCRTESNREPLI